MKKAIVFDLDNTLEEWLPFENSVEEVMSAELSQKFGFDPARFKMLFDDVKVGYLQQHSVPRDYGRDRWFTEALARVGVFDVDVEPFVDRYWDLLLARVRLFPGTRELLEELEKSFKLAVLTDSDGDPFWKRERIRRLHIAECFSVILTSDDVGANKPHPRCFTRVAEELGVHPGECYMVGDHPEVDLATAHELGMTTIWQRQGLPPMRKENFYPYVDRVVDDIREVRDIVLATTAEVRQ